MRIYRPGNVEWDVNATTTPPCPCWAWAYAPEMGAYRELDDGNAHHPCCQRTLAGRATRATREGE